MKNNRIDFFDYNGNRYYTGTEIIIKDPYCGLMNAYFVYHDAEWGMYAYKYGAKYRYVTPENFFRMLQQVTEKRNSNIHAPQKKQLKDSQIPKLIAGWILYLTIMTVATIFNARIVIWILTTVMFSSWRKDVIEKEGYYVEW